MVLEQGLEPESIVCVTFTNKVSAREERGREEEGRRWCEVRADLSFVDLGCVFNQAAAEMKER